MSIFGAMNTAVSGLNSQSVAFGNISDNVANSQTVGYKQVDTNFEDYLTQSTPTSNTPGSVAATASYENSVQGTVTATNNDLNLAVSGNGFFAVNTATGVSATGTPTISTTQDYTRAGDFSLDANGYLVNSEGDYLDGWNVDPATGAATTNTLAPIQVSNASDPPTESSSISLSTNLPTTPASTAALTSNVNVYDNQGNSEPLTLSYAQSATTANTWTMTVAQNGTAIGTADLGFGADGTLETLANPTGGVTIPGNASGTGTAAGLSFTPTTGNFTAPITLNMGNFGSSSGVTQFAGSNLDLNSLTQNGLPSGTYSGTTINSTGQVIANYSNGNNLIVAQVPLANFADADGLQRQNGQNFTATTDSGTANVVAENTDGAGSLVTSSVESSNVNLSLQLTQLIVAQQAYSANTKVVTAADQLLQTTISMVT